MLPILLEPFQHSFRKRLSQKPKFYLFDTGVTRSLARTLSLPFQESTSAYGEAFEHFVVLECIKNATYFFPEYRFSYLRTKDDAEVDLVVESPGLPLLFIEIKSSKTVNAEDLTTLTNISRDYKDCESICLCRDDLTRQVGSIKIMPWQKGVADLFMPRAAKELGE
jgi:predicted AAA+ superfamily ATPase